MNVSTDIQNGSLEMCQVLYVSLRFGIHLQFHVSVTYREISFVIFFHIISESTVLHFVDK